MVRQEPRCASRSTSTVAQAITQYKARSVVTLAEMETTHVENVMLVGRRSSRRPMLGIIAFFRWAVTVFLGKSYWITYLAICSSFWQGNSCRCRVSGQIGMPGCCTKCAYPADQQWHQRRLHPMLYQFSYCTSLHTEEGTPRTHCGWHREGATGLGRRA